MVEIREKDQNDDTEEVVSLATEDLRRIYRPCAHATGKPPSGHSLTTLVAVKDKNIVGVIEYFAGDGAIHFQGLAVHPVYRRQGIASVLVKEIESIAIRLGAQKVVLNTILETGNPGMFTKLGYEITSVVPASDFEGLDGKQVTKVGMRRILA
ncbi:MAG: GNAT family N-acetyltransferase [Proteobacteria bacterium]|nr:MAG: GNAT family N-acetyltransferase [Pseudomonadota bacterium]QKK10530.1 MAG: GNAT family N-acetyltransferase [Pseudomonadota bacterium]